LAEPQRAWRAACPNCGAPVEFRSAASASAVCGYCRSTLVRDGESLRRIGRSAEIFDDFSPLQLGVSGALDGVGFTLVGRVQFGTEDGPWNEWHALFDNGRDGWLSEDNGRYVFAFDAPPPDDAPPPQALSALRPATTLGIDGRPWSVASVVSAHVIAAEGELLEPPPADRAIAIVDLRNAAGEVGTLDDAASASVHWSIGRSVALATLALAGLRDVQEKTLKAQGLPCPQCGAPLPVTLSTSLSVVCASCKAVVDLARTAAAELPFFAQVNPHEPQIPIGTTGHLTMPWMPATAPPLDWQVVGYQERLSVAQGGGASEGWREYLLYNRLEGFTFLVDTNEGWSLVRVLTGAPVVQGAQAFSEGITYGYRSGYDSVVTYVLGEFYWKVEANQATRHHEFLAYAGNRPLYLSQESTPHETTWSAGAAIPPGAVAAVFGLAPPQAALLQRGGGPPDLAQALNRWWVLLLLLLVVVVGVTMCSRDACDAQRRAFGTNSAEYRACRARSAAGAAAGAWLGSTGGAWGGYSSGGGGHK
jgi:hypothetical protein